jgi:hypothetical protein
MKKYCGRCGAPLEMVKISQSGESPPLRLSVKDMPAAACAKGHASPVDPDFMIWLIHELKDRESALAAGHEKGMLFFKKGFCACGAELPASSARSATFSFDLQPESYPAFKAELEIPVYQCTGCGKEQARSHPAIHGLTSQAVMRLHDAAGFPHA